MILRLIMGQRKQSYDGEYAPEALECIDQYSYEENPDWILDRLAERKQENEWSSVVLINVRVDGNAISALLNPKTPFLDGDVLGEHIKD